ncbi:MAG: glycosyltransferase family 2 protein [Bacteroidia bacterium]|nr:glycosyltransferase family 2 protein [Bacteroidia bacterium]
MKVSGFSFIKNAIKFDYPIIEAITSILPICDEFVVAVGKSDDDTLEYIKSINSPKIKIIETIWDESLREGGRVLADETNKAFRAISADSDWAFYIQGDEVIHEKYLDNIKNAMLKYKDDKAVDGLVFDHLNFYGSYDYIADSRHWQKKEIRVVRNQKNIYSFKDAMSFRKDNDDKLNVAYVNACIYHYGWVKAPAAMQQKQLEFQKLWHDDNWIKENVPQVDEFDFSKIDSVALFKETHPKVMEQRLKRLTWKFTFDPTKAKKSSLRRTILNAIYKSTGIHIGEFKNYNLIRK